MQKLLAKQSTPSDLQLVQAWSLSNPSLHPAHLDQKPGHKWDPFLPVLEHSTPSALSGLRQHLHYFISRWLKPLAPFHTSETASQLDVVSVVLPTTNLAIANASLQEDDEPVGFTNSTWVPVLPSAIAWMMHDAEKRIDQAGVNLRKAQLLAQLTSISYCNRPNIKAWNCTR